ncbi:MAG: sigma-54 dependent transcriptional regulator [Pseudomonadota bacterium]
MNTERILVVDDEPDICGLVSDILTDEGFQVNAAENAASAREQLQQSDYDLVLLDIWMPDEDGITLLKDWKSKKALHCPVVMMSGHGTVETAVEATRLGAFSFVEKPLTTAKLISTIRKALDSHIEEQESDGFVPSVKSKYVHPVGTSPVMQDLMKLCDRCAQVKTNLLIHGEEGAGRYTSLRHIHELSDRSKHPFVLITNDQFNFDKVNEGSWSKFKTNLIDSIKFAEGGTVLLQNIDKCNDVVQKRLLDLLQQLVTVQVFKRFDVKFCLSITSDCSANIAALIQKMFSMTRINVPPLREHVADIPELLNHFIDQFCATDNYTYRKCSIAAQNAFFHYDWPSNISELKLMVQQLLVTGDSEEITIEEVKEVIGTQTSLQNKQSDIDTLFDLPLREARETFEKQYLLHQLKKVDGSVSKLAELVGLERTNLYRKLRSLGIANKD